MTGEKERASPREMGRDLVDLITSITTNPHLVMLLMIVFLLVIGCALDTVGMIFIFVPVLFPLAEAVGIDPLPPIARSSALVLVLKNRVTTV